MEVVIFWVLGWVFLRAFGGFLVFGEFFYMFIYYWMIIGLGGVVLSLELGRVVFYSRLMRVGIG